MQSCSVKEQASTLSFFGFLNLRSRNRDLDENDAEKHFEKSIVKQAFRTGS